MHAVASGIGDKGIEWRTMGTMFTRSYALRFMRAIRQAGAHFRTDNTNGVAEFQSKSRPSICMRRSSQGTTWPTPAAQLRTHLQPHFLAHAAQQGHPMCTCAPPIVFGLAHTTATPCKPENHQRFGHSPRVATHHSTSS